MGLAIGAVQYPEEVAGRIAPAKRECIGLDVARANQSGHCLLSRLAWNTNSTRFETVDTGDALKDTLGNTYAVGNLFTLSSTSGWSSEIGSAEYNLGYKYDHLTGTISVKEDSDEATGVLKIIGDDKTLYSLNLQRALTPTSFDVDVSSVNWLKITIEDPQNGNIIAILSDWQFGVGNSEPETTTTTGEGGDTTTETTTETTAG